MRCTAPSATVAIESSVSPRFAGRGIESEIEVSYSVNQSISVPIPTRDAEKSRFEAKVQAGATFALTQLLFSDRVADVLSEIKVDGPPPEILLSFGYVPKAEGRIGLIRRLTRDDTEAARAEMQFVEELAPQSFARKREVLVDLFKRVTDRAREAGFPLGLHFEAPYGFSRPAL